MTDQNPLVDKVRETAAAMRDAMNREDDDYTEAQFLSDMSGYIADLEALLSPRPTLAGMTLEERAECRWLQADTESWGRVVILDPYENGGNVILVDERGTVIPENHSRVTPRPDLPRMVWPGDTMCGPALPGEWRLAEHPDHGRVIVTRPTQDSDGNVLCVIPSTGYLGHNWQGCKPAELTYID